MRRYLHFLSSFSVNTLTNRKGIHVESEKPTILAIMFGIRNAGPSRSSILVDSSVTITITVKIIAVIYAFVVLTGIIVFFEIRNNRTRSIIILIVLLVINDRIEFCTLLPPMVSNIISPIDTFFHRYLITSILP